MELHKTINKEVAARLLSDVQPPLQQAAVWSRDLPMMRLRFDTFLLTVRAAIVEDTILAQLLRRLVAIARGVKAYGLYPHCRQSAAGIAACAVDSPSCRTTSIGLPRILQRQFGK